MESGSAIQGEVGYETALRLPRPTGKDVQLDANGSTFIRPDAIEAAMTSLDEGDDSSFITLATMTLQGDGAINTGNVTSENIERFIKLLHNHEATRGKVKNSTDVLKNRVFSGIYQVTRSSQNQLKAQITVDTCTEDLKKAAAATASGTAEKKITPYNPASKMTMQEQNMLGKAVVGIGAVSLKTYFILSTWANKKVMSVAEMLNRGRFEDAVELINDLEILRPSLNGKPERVTIANTNLDPIIEALAKYGEEAAPLIARVHEWKANMSKMDTPEYLSGIISLAADNAKDLALPKLNATADLVDIYTTSAMLGIPFEVTKNVMTSSVFNWMTKTGAKNIFDARTLENDVKGMVDFFLLKKTSLPKTIQYDLIKTVQEYNNRAEKNGQEKIEFKKVEDLLRDAKALDKLLSILEGPNGLIATSSTTISRNDEDYDDSLDIDEEGETRERIPDYTKSDYALARENIKKYREACDYWAVQKNREAIYYLSDILYMVEEMSTLGQQGSINQGLKTDPQAFRRSIDNMASLLNRRIKDYNKNAGRHNKAVLEANRIGVFQVDESLPDFKANKKFVDSWNQEAAKNGISDRLVTYFYTGEDDNFDFMRYMSDVNYKSMIDNQLRWVKAGIDNISWRGKNGDHYNFQAGILSGFQIFDALSNSPNFYAMSRLMPVADILAKSSISIYAAADEMGERFKTSMTSNDFDALVEYFTDRNILKFFKESGLTLDLDGIKAEIEDLGVDSSPIGIYVGDAEDIRTTPATKLILDDVQSLASFKHIMENHIIPALKASDKYRNNQFIQGLVSKRNKKIDVKVMGLPIDMMNAESDEGTQDKFNNYVIGFDQLAQDDFAGMKLGDWFFFYNLVCNKNGYGDQALTKIFASLINSDNVPEGIQAYYSVIDTISSEANEDEANDYIARHSRNTKFVEKKAVPAYKNPDATFDLPYDTAISGGQPHPIITSWQSLNGVPATEVLQLFVDKINALSPGMAEINTPEEMEENYKEFNNNSVKAFIKNGVVHFNLQAIMDNNANINDAMAIGIHELAHIAFAGIKALSPDDERVAKFYKMLREVRKSDKYDDYAKNYEGMVGSDLDEEVLCSMLEDVLRKGIDFESAVPLRNGSLFTEGLLAAMGMSLADFEDDFDGNLYEDNPIMYALFEGISTVDQTISRSYVANNQAIAGLKKMLLENGKKEKSDFQKNHKLDQEC